VLRSRNRKGRDVGVAARVTGRVALLRDRRCAFIEREQAKGLNVGSRRGTPVARERNPTRHARRYADAPLPQMLLNDFLSLVPM